jgi:cob(I)alamin adenosyltransferase
MILRAVGHGQRVGLIRFLKKNTNSGELAVLAQLPGVEVRTMGLGFVPKPEATGYPAHRDAARNAFALACEWLGEETFDLIVLDEICGAVSRGPIDETEVAAMMERPRKSCLVLTGRNAPDSLVERADTVTEMRCVRHGLADGIPAQKGVEW